MDNEIITYDEMTRREGGRLQRGMHYRLHPGHSVILSTYRKNAPYSDRIHDNESTLIYQGHDVFRNKKNPDPKFQDQEEFTSTGKLTQNGKFHNAAQEYKAGLRAPEKVRVYEKIKPGIWSYNGLFHLVDSWREKERSRYVFKFKLIAVDENRRPKESDNRRLIPSKVKQQVWKRDKGRCVICGVTDELHFDHIIPISKGGTSKKAENIQLLCARHNLEKRDRII